MTLTVSWCHDRTVLLMLALVACLSGCGPAPSDESSGRGATANVSDNGTGTASGGGLTPFSALRGVSVPLGTGTGAGGKDDSPQDRLVIPDWIANDLSSPDIQVRLKAIDRWAQSALTGSVDLLIQALEDQDERIQARALELIVQDWAREQERAGSE